MGLQRLPVGHAVVVLRTLVVGDRVGVLEGCQFQGERTRLQERWSRRRRNPPTSRRPGVGVAPRIRKALDQAHDLLVQAGAICAKAADESDNEESKAAEVEAAKGRYATGSPNLKLPTEIAEHEIAQIR